MNKQRIFIKHFENPESFSFTQYDVQLAKLEEQLYQHSVTRRLSPISPSNIVDGDITAIYYKPWQKYILSKIVVNTDSPNSYRAWLINYGFHVKLSNNLVYKVSEDVNVDPYSTCIQKGGILDISSGKGNLWATEICQEICNVIKNAANIYFIKRYTDSDGHHWGELKVCMRNGKVTDVANYLVKNGYAVRSYKCETIKSLERELGDTQLEQSSELIGLRSDSISNNTADQQDRLPANESFGFSALPEFQKENPCTHTGVVKYPAGFDIARLHKYNDPNHWHIRKSTRMNEKKPKYKSRKGSFDECRKVEKLNNTHNTESVKALSRCQPEYVPFHSTWEPMPPKPEPFDFDMFPPKPRVGRSDLNSNLNKMSLVTSVNKIVCDETASLMRSNKLVGKGRGSLLAALANLDKNLSVAPATQTIRLSCFISKHEEEKLMEDARGSEIYKPLRQDLSNRIVQSAKTVSDAHNGVQLKSNLLGSLVIAHSAVPLKQCFSLDTAGFTIPITYAMRSMNFNQLYSIQSYAWPHLSCRNSLVLVNGSTSGKSWCYLPKICDLLIQHIPKRQTQLQHGPSAIILVATQGHIKQTALMCEHLLEQFNRVKWKTVVTYFHQKDTSQILINLINGCGILITTPRLFLSLVEEHKQLDCLFNKDVLNHIVIDDLDQMLTYSKECCIKLIVKLFQLFGSDDKLNVPLIITSRQWISRLMLKIIQLMHKPLLLIGDFVEAAAYGKINVFVKICKRDEKIPLVVNQIAVMNAINRIIVIVGRSNDEINYLNAAFRTHDMLTYDYTQNGTIRDTQSGRQQIVIVCTDEELTKIQITNAHIVIHLSMPNSWEQFTRRFNLISDSIPNYVANNFDIDKTKISASLQTIIYVHKDSDSHHMPYLIEFLRRHNINISQATENSINELHTQHKEGVSTTRKGMPLCTYLLDGSSCLNTLCEQRHQLARSDLATKEQNAIAVNDDVCIQVLEIYTPTHVSAQLLRHKPNNGEWKTFFNLNAKLSMGLDIYYSDPKNCVHHWPQRVNDICVIKMENHYARVRLIKETKCLKDPVIAKLLDRGSQLLQLKSSELLVCADKFRKEPATATDIRLTGLVANNDEQQWCEKAIEATKNWLYQTAKNNCEIHARIDCMLKETIFVKNIIVMEYLPTISTYVYKVDLKSSLKKHGFAKEKFGISEIKQLIELQLQQQSQEDAEVSAQKVTCSENVNSKICEQKQHSEGLDNIEFGLHVSNRIRDNILQTNREKNSCLQVQKSNSNFDKFTAMLKSCQDLYDQAADDIGHTFIGDILDSLPWKNKSSINAENKKVLSSNETKEQLINAAIVTSSQPQLIVEYKYPKISWHDSAAYVQLEIHAGDNTNYEISWQADTLLYAAESRNEACSLQLRGLIDTKHVMHELRGLNVIVKMKKQICGKWSRLLKKGTTQTPWLKYNIDRYLAEPTGLSEAQQKLRIICGIEAYNFVEWYHTSEYNDCESDEFDIDFTELNTNDDN